MTRFEPWTRLAGLSYAFEDLKAEEQTGEAALALVHAGHIVIRAMLGQRSRDEAMRALDAAQKLIVKADKLTPKVMVRTAEDRATLIVLRVAFPNEKVVHYIPKALQRGAWRQKVRALCGIVPLPKRGEGVYDKRRWSIAESADTRRTCSACNSEASKLYATVGEPRRGAQGRVIG